MKIAEIRQHHLSVPLQRPVRTSVHNYTHAHTVVVEMRSDDGLAGVGYCFAFRPNLARSFAALIDEAAELYQGRDPREVRALYAAASKALWFVGHTGAALVALAALDTACWDLAARAAGLSLYRYLGGAAGRVPTYASSGLWLDYSTDKLLAEAEQFKREGHRAMKMRLGRANHAEDIERVRLVREALGPDIKLLADVNQGWDEATAIRVGRRLEPFDLFWLEEPLHYEDLEGCARVAAALDTRIATGESDYGRAGMKRHLDLRAADVLMPDLQRIGGVTEYLEIAALCDAYRQPVSSHLFMEASAHVLAASPNALILEHMGWFEELFTGRLKIEEGHVVLPEGPGLGFELDPKALQRFRA